MSETSTTPEGAFFTHEGKEYIIDDGEPVEIACSYPDMETAIKALHKDQKTK